MVCKKSIISKVLIVFAIIFLFYNLGISANASSSVPRAIWNYDGVEYYYYKTDNFTFCYDGDTYIYDFPEDVLVFPLLFNNTSGTQFFVYVFSKNSLTFTRTKNGVVSEQSTWSTSGGWYYKSFGRSGAYSTTMCDLPNSNNVFVSTPKDYIIGYLNSETFVEPSSPDFVNTSTSRNDTDFCLYNVQAECESDILTLSWSMPFSLPDDVESMPILLDLLIENTETGESAIYYYPSTESRFVRPSLCDVSDLSVSFDVRDIKDIPTNFNIKSLTLTPYYVQHLEYLDMDILYKGQNSIVFLNYSGQNDKVYSDLVIQAPPDTTLNEEDVPTSIFGAITNFFSGFFRNFGNMLKDLFIPSKEQIQSLFGDMENFFSDKLGFLWFPFDLAITIVETFTYGEADSMLTVPPITINILGGIDLYPGGQFDMDSTGIFPYVRIVTSILLACAVAGLAYNKWDEWIGGHDN